MSNSYPASISREVFHSGDQPVEEAKADGTLILRYAYAPDGQMIFRERDKNEFGVNPFNGATYPADAGINERVYVLYDAMGSTTALTAAGGVLLPGENGQTSTATAGQVVERFAYDQNGLPEAMRGDYGDWPDPPIPVSPKINAELSHYGFEHLYHGQRFHLLLESFPNGVYAGLYEGSGGQFQDPHNGRMVQPTIQASSGGNGYDPNASTNFWSYLPGEVWNTLSGMAQGVAHFVMNPGETYNRVVNATAGFIGIGMGQRDAAGWSGLGNYAMSAWEGAGYLVGSAIGVRQVGEAAYGLDITTAETLSGEERLVRGFAGLSALAFTGSIFAASYNPILATGRLDRALTFYHGTSAEAARGIRAVGPDLSKAAARSDFGRAFYTTLNRSQAARFVAKEVISPEVLSFRVSAYRFARLNNLAYRQAGSGWGMFVESNRFATALNPRFLHGYDTISGPLLLRVDSGMVLSAGGQQTAWISQRGIELLSRGLQ